MQLRALGGDGTRPPRRNLIGYGRDCHSWGFMPTFLYRCPNTGKNVQGWVADDLAEHEDYKTVVCSACRRAHQVNPKTGRVIGGDDDEEPAD
jgi:hypothetical protein